MTQAILNHAEDRMKKAVQVLTKDLSTLRAGRANPALLDRIQVEYYGTATPLNQVGSINVPDPRTLLIQPWDKTVLGEIEKAILKSDLGLTPSNDGDVIRINIPMLTEERRMDLVKQSRKMAEESKVAVRNIRRDANEDIKKMEKTDISEDESRSAQESVQKLTDKYIKQIDEIMSDKEKEIMEV